MRIMLMEPNQTVMRGLGMLEQVLQTEQEALEREKDRLQAQIAAAQERLREIEERLAHVHGLLNPSNGVKALHGRNGSHTSHHAVDLAFEILSERNGETMYYKDLASEVQARGGDISGENAAQILVARLVKDERFVRPIRKGFYARRKDYPNAQNVGERKRPSANRNRTTRRNA